MATADPIRILGVMTGTSCDALDAACVEFAPGGDWTPLWTASLPYPLALRKRVLASQIPGVKLSTQHWLALDRDLGQWYGEALAKLLSKHTGADAPDVIANHGQTVAHFPDERDGGFTWQLGNPSWITEKTGLTVVSHFRDGDMAAGGQGAPMVPRFHLLLARKLASVGRGLAIHNLGGISNLTYCPADGDPAHAIAFDTGPANVWIDAATAVATGGKARFDRGGRIAARGTPDEKAIAKILKMPFFAKRPPKSTGRDDFPYELFKKSTRARGADLVATATEITARSIGATYRRFIAGAGLDLERVILSGGGALNPTLVQAIRLSLEDVCPVETLSERGWDPQWVEAEAFAYLGWLGLRGESLGGPWTGAVGDASGARITPGKNWRQVSDHFLATR